jgi:hypothetical protein
MVPKTEKMQANMMPIIGSPPGIATRIQKGVIAIAAIGTTPFMAVSM